MNATLATPQPVSDDVAALRRAVAQARQRRRNPRDHGPRRLDPRPATPRPGARGTSNAPATTTRRSSTASTTATTAKQAPRRQRSVDGTRGDGSSAAGPSSAAGTIAPMAMTFWTSEEEARLVQELRDGLTIEDIATAHQRTPTAVLARTSRMAPEDLDLRTRAERTEWLREQLLIDPDYDWLAPLTVTRRRQQQETRAKAPRNGAVWTAAEDEQVLAAVTTGVSIRDLAAQLQRSTKSTARRIHYFAHRDDAMAPAAAVTAAQSAPTPAGDPTVSVPGAHGQPWSAEEISQLLEELREGRSVADVAKAHQRSLRAVHGRAAGVLSELTGRKHRLAEATTDELRAYLTRKGNAVSTTQLDEQDAVATLREIPGATPLDA